MDLMVNTFLRRAENELMIAEKLMQLSEDKPAKEFMRVPEAVTFYSSVISHSYYAIFYSSKAILLARGIKTSAPEVHMKTFEEFKRVFVDTGILDMKLLEIYKKMAIRADELLEIFRDEKWKRGNFTYNTISQANKEPAGDSLRNAKLFVSNIEKVIQML
jgi:uncharacterized protein (UPF0332 family)